MEVWEDLGRRTDEATEGEGRVKWKLRNGKVEGWLWLGMVVRSFRQRAGVSQEIEKRFGYAIGFRLARSLKDQETRRQRLDSKRTEVPIGKTLMKAMFSIL